MLSLFARQGVGRMVTGFVAAMAIVSGTLVASSSLSSAAAADPVATTTTLKLNADGTGTVEVTAEGGVTPTNYVDLWIDSTWQKPYTLTNGKATVDLGTQPHGDHQIYVRYREDSTTRSSDAITTWTAPGTVAVNTTTTLKLNPDGTGIVEVTADGVTPTNYVDLWIDSTWQKAYALTNGKANVDLGTQPHGDHQIYVRYRENSTTKSSDAIVAWTAPGTVASPTTTTLKLNADGTGTVQVTAQNGVTPSNYVDLWIDWGWQKAYALTNGKATIDLGTQPQGDHVVYVRYRENSTTQASDAITMWTAPGTVASPTTTTLKLNADGTGTVQVTAQNGVTPTNYVDLWIDSTWQKAYALTGGKANVDLGTQPQGDHVIYVRYRENSTTASSDAIVTWTAPGTVASPTTTTLKLNADGTGTVEVTAQNGVTPTNYVDLWIDWGWQKAYALTNGKATIDLGTQPAGDHVVYVRYRENSTTQASDAITMWTAPGTVAAPTTTTLKMNADGTGTVQVTAQNGVTPTNYVDLWIDSTWQKAYALTGGKADIDVGTQAHGDHVIYVRYRENSTTQASDAITMWTAPGTVASPTTTTLKLNADGTGTVQVTAQNGVTPTNYVDLWIDSTWQKAYALTDGKTTVDLGDLPGGEYQIYVRYRENSTTASSDAVTTHEVTTAEQVPTKTTVTVLPDGTGTIQVTAANKVPTNLVDLWVDDKYKGAYTLTGGKATFELGTRPGGDVPVLARYRPSATDQASQATAVWSVDTAPKPDPADCGVTILKANGQAWTCTFADDFSGTTLDRTKWTPQEIFGSGFNDLACYVDSPENISVSGGALHLTLLKGEPKPCAGHENVVTPYTSGMVSTFHKWSQKYGRFEARVKNTATTASGLHEAFWLWPDSRYPEGQGEWPDNGEIDIAETYSNNPDLIVPFLHSILDLLGSILTGTTQNTAYTCRAQRGVYNTYALEWSPERLEIFVNGHSCLVNTSGDPAFNKRYIMAFTQALGSQGNEVTVDTTVPATMSIDYVHAWS